MAFVLAGVPNAVATCGTALADEHFLTLKNLARKVTLAYDADAAGQAAAERCYQWEQRFEVQFQVADLPAGPRSRPTCGRTTRSSSSPRSKGAQPFLEFRLDRLLRGGRHCRRSKAGRAPRTKARCSSPSTRTISSATST